MFHCQQMLLIEISDSYNNLDLAGKVFAKYFEKSFMYIPLYNVKNYIILHDVEIN